MIRLLARKISHYYIEKGIIDEIKVNILSYGFELLISTIINFFIIFCIAYIFDIVIETILFLISFIPLRLTAGGYHAKHHWSCILGFQASYCIIAFFLKLLPSKCIYWYTILSITVTVFLLFLYAPIEPVNKPIDDKHKKIQKRKSIIICFMQLLIIQFFYSTFQLQIKSIAFFASGTFFNCILVIVGKIVRTNFRVHQSRKTR